MKSIILIMSMLLGGCATLYDNLKLSYDLPTAGTTWIERNPPTEPLNSTEILAAQSAAGLRAEGNKETAYYEGKDGSFTLIRHERITTGDEPYVTTIRYRIMDGQIFGETNPTVVVLLDPKKEQIAHEVAINAVNGIIPEIPMLYSGRMFIAKMDSSSSISCRVDVVEKDLNREYVTYHIKTC